MQSAHRKPSVMRVLAAGRESPSPETLRRQGSGSAHRQGAGRSIQHYGLKRRHVLATAHGIARVCALHEMVQIARVAVNSVETGMVGRRGLAKAVPAPGEKRKAPAGAGACMERPPREPSVKRFASRRPRMPSL